MWKAFRSTMLLAVLFLVLARESRAQPIVIDTIALSGDPGLNTGDPVIGVAGSVAIDSTGKVMFFVTTERDGTRTVNLATSNGTITSVLPGFDFLTASDSVVLNSSETVAFGWFEGVAKGSRNGVFIGSNLANLAFVDAETLALPGNTEDVFVVVGRPTLNKSGVVAFSTGFTSLGDQPLESTNGIFFGTGSGGLTRIILAGDQAHGTAEGTVFSSVSRPVINDRGDVAFFGRLQLADSEVGTNGETGIWLYGTQTGQVQLVARAGDALLPGMEDGTNFIGISDDGFAIDPNGDVIFEATFAPPRLVPRTRMWRGSSPGTLEPLFGVTKPSSLGFDAETQVKDDVVITTAGDLVFRSESLPVVDGEIQTQTRVRGAIWKDTGEFLDVIMHVGVGVDLPGSDAPGTGGTFTGTSQFTANGAGRVAFISQYEVGGDIQGRGLWAQDSQGVIQLVALEDEPLMTQDGLKTVSGLTLLAGPGNVSGFSSSYNDGFELAFTAIFDDFSSGIFRAIVDTVEPPPVAGDEFFWNRACGNDDWHAQCAAITNWNDANNEPQQSPPGDAGQEIVTIANADVVIQQKAVAIDSLSATGSLTVNQPLTLARDSNIEALKLNADLTTNGVLTLSGEVLTGNNVWTSGRILGDGSVVLSEGSKLEILPPQSGSDLRILAPAFTNNGKIVMLGGRLSISDSLTNTATGTFDLQKAGGEGGLQTEGVAGGTITNKGIFKKSPAAGEDGGNEIVVDSRFVNEPGGTISVETGTLAFTGTTHEHKGGNYEVAEDATLEFRNGVNLGSVNVTGEVTATGVGTVRLANSRYSVNTGAIAKFNLSGETGLVLDGATIAGGGSVRLSGNGAWQSGDIGDKLEGGTLNNVGTSSGTNFVISGSGIKRLVGRFNNGTDSGGPDVADLPDLLSSRVTHQAEATVVFDGGTLENLGFYFLHGSFSGANGKFINENTFMLSEPNVTRTIDVEFDNRGLIDVAPGSTLELTGKIPQLDEAAKVLKAARWIVRAGATIDFKRDMLIEKIAKLVAITIHKNGRLSVLPDASNSSGVPLVNNGLFFIVEGTTFSTSGFLENNGQMLVDATSRLIVNGQFETNEGSMISIRGSLTTTDLDVDGGFFGGNGTINAQRFSNRGKLLPGDSPGVMTIGGDYTQFEEGSLEIEIGGTHVGTNHDQLVINGNADIRGTLVLKFIDDFSPQAGQTFDFLAVSETQTGEFESVEIVDLAPGFEFEVTPTDGGMMMTAMNDGVFTGIVGEINDVTLGFNSPEAETTAAPGDTNVPMLQFEVVPEADGLNISSLTLSAAGSGDDAMDLAGITVWVDQDGDGRVGFDEPSIGSGTYDVDNGTLVLSIDPPLEVAPRETTTLLVAYNITGAEEENDAEANENAKVANDRDASPKSRVSLGLGALLLPLIVSLGLIATRKRRSFALLCLFFPTTVWITGCRMDGTIPGTGATTVTFRVTLTAIAADETGTGADASVDNLSLAGTNLTVSR